MYAYLCAQSSQKSQSNTKYCLPSSDRCVLWTYTPCVYSRSRKRRRSTQYVSVCPFSRHIKLSRRSSFEMQCVRIQLYNTCVLRDMV